MIYTALRYNMSMCLSVWRRPTETTENDRWLLVGRGFFLWFNAASEPSPLRRLGPRVYRPRLCQARGAVCRELVLYTAAAYVQQYVVFSVSI